MESALLDTGRLETLARQETFVHRIDPRAKVVTAAVFIVTVISFDKYTLSAFLPFLVYPVVMTEVGRLPAGYLLGKLILVSPFALFIGIFNPFLDREVLLVLGPLGVSGGWVSFASIMLRFLLTVSAALILVATTGFHSICLALSRLRVPNVFVVQLLLLFRYLFVLVGEATRLMKAHSLRSLGSRGVRMGVYRSLVGQLLLRAMDRAHRIYVAMLCRGFDGEVRMVRRLKFRAVDAAFILSWLGFFAVARYYNLSQVLGKAALEFFQ